MFLRRYVSVPIKYTEDTLPFLENVVTVLPSTEFAGILSEIGDWNYEHRAAIGSSPDQSMAHRISGMFPSGYTRVV